MERSAVDARVSCRRLVGRPWQGKAGTVVDRQDPRAPMLDVLGLDTGQTRPGTAKWPGSGRESVDGRTQPRDSTSEHLGSRWRCRQNAGLSGAAS